MWLLIGFMKMILKHVYFNLISPSLAHGDQEEGPRVQTEPYHRGIDFRACRFNHYSDCPNQMLKCFVLVWKIRECLDQYENLFVISMFNQRNIFLKELRSTWSDSKFLFGKNKVVSVALGRGPESEYKDNLHKVSEKLKGNVGLLFTNRSKEDVVKSVHLPVSLVLKCFSRKRSSKTIFSS